MAAKKYQNPIFLLYLSMQKEQIRFLIEVFTLSGQYTTASFDQKFPKVDKVQYGIRTYLCKTVHCV